MRHSSWNQRTKSAATQTHRKPRSVGVEVHEREPLEPGVLQALDVVFYMRVGSHVSIECDGIAFLVGVVAPVAELQ